MPVSAVGGALTSSAFRAPPSFAAPPSMLIRSRTRCLHRDFDYDYDYVSEDISVSTTEDN